MKLRIKGNSIRLRLMQSEVKTLEQTAQVKDSLCFPGGEELLYELRISNKFETVFNSNSLTVTIPEPDAFRWIQTEEVGIENSFELPNADTLTLLIEKDFNCLADRPNEDESDAYPNPAESC